MIIKSITDASFIKGFWKTNFRIFVFLCVSHVHASGVEFWNEYTEGMFTCFTFYYVLLLTHRVYPDNEVHGANMGPIWGRQDPGGPHVDPKNFAIWVLLWH